MQPIYLIAGGCRSGKSSFAYELANKTQKNKIFLATAEAFDKEMQTRISLHQKERSKDWTTIEEPLDLTQKLESNVHEPSVLLLDCLSLWVSNLMLKGIGEAQIHQQVLELINYLKANEHEAYIVTNEVGLGIVPENKLARDYRDILGRLHQKLQIKMDEVFFCSMGIPLALKRLSQLSMKDHDALL